MIQGIIVEDEKYTLLEIKELLENSNIIDVCGTYQNPLKVIEDFDHIKPQVVFLDISMPEMDGMTLAELLMNKDPDLYVVFITGYNHYAVKAFDLNAIDYILKPINPERFMTMVNRLEKMIGPKRKEIQSISVSCFGDFEVAINGKPVKWERTKAEELMAYFLMNHNKKIHKAIIIDTLWEYYEPDKALRILQTVVHKLRTIISPMKEFMNIIYEDNSYSLLIKNFQFDLLETERKIRELDVKYANASQIEELKRILDKGLFANKGYIWAYGKEMGLRKSLQRKL